MTDEDFEHLSKLVDQFSRAEHTEKRVLVKLRDLCAKYRTALQFYADEGNYNVSSAPVIQHLHYESADKGDKAREALLQ